MRTWSELLQFDKIRLVHNKDWPHQWLTTGSAPGDLLLFDGPLGETGGLLKITRAGTFITVSADAIFRESLIQWPGADANFGIKLRGKIVEVVMSK